MKKVRCNGRGVGQVRVCFSVPSEIVKIKTEPICPHRGALTCGLVDMWSDCCVPINLCFDKTQELHIYFYQTRYTETRNIPGLETISYNLCIVFLRIALKHCLSINKTLRFSIFRSIAEPVFVMQTSALVQQQSMLFPLSLQYQLNNG